MSLPPGFLDELRNRLSLSQVVGRKVMWDKRKSNQGKGDLWAPCPFHHEKTASFHVDDRKGYYYCFGCHAKGDAISFVRETENVSFIEAIEILAQEAGMTMPERDPRAQEKADRRTQLIEVMEQAVQFFRLQLKTNAGGEARAYLARRGLSDAAIDRWEIGFALPGWQNLWDFLTAKNIAPELILEAGLAKPSDKGRQPYDTFRHRIMFPIRDARGRAIAFGGRAMDPNDNAKYLNSPETPLFDKSRTLFNHGPAREAAGKGQQLIVAEGYMDVIALSEAGFQAAVAPLGTAVTETQLQMLWRIHSEPVVALDGDKAGIGAARRVMDLALPLLEAGQSLRFAMMPEGQDPDDVIRAGGPSAMDAILSNAQPMVRILWERETEGRVFDSPERKAALDKDLRAAVTRIKDQVIRRHYGDEINNLRWELFGRNRRGNDGQGAPRGAGRPRQGGWQKGGFRVPMAQPVTKSSALVTAPPKFDEEVREAVILATLITHPYLLPDFLHELERLDFIADDHRRLRGALLTHIDLRDVGRLKSEIAGTVGPGLLEKLFARRQVQIAPPMIDPDDGEKAALCVAEELAKLDAARGAAREIEEAMMDFDHLADENMTWRLGQAAEARNRAGRGDTEDKGQYDIGPNGARINRDERNAFAALLDQIGHGKGNGGRT